VNDYTDGRSMRGSGIYAETVDYDAFICENMECLSQNQAGYTFTDDWGNYSVECQDCGLVYLESSVASDAEDRLIDAMVDAWKERWV